MRADNSHHLAAAARRRRDQTLERAQTALSRAETNGGIVSVAAFAQSAGVSRAWLYAQPELRERIQRLPSRDPDGPPAQQRASTASQQRRLELAYQRIAQLTQENRQLREQLARVLGEHRATDR